MKDEFIRDAFQKLVASGLVKTKSNKNKYYCIKKGDR